MGDGVEGRVEKPEPWAKTARSSAYSPMAMATCFSDGKDGEVMMPKGMLAREKCEPLEMETHDFGLVEGMS